MSAMQNTIFVFIPDSLEKSNVGFLNGFVVNEPNQNAFYITRDKLNMDPAKCIGYCGMSVNISKDNWIHINYYDGTLRVNKISCDDNNQDYNLIFIVYDYFTFCNSEIVQLKCQTFGQHFGKLKENTQHVTVNSDRKCSAMNSVTMKTFGMMLLITNFILFTLQLFPRLMHVSSTVSLLYETIATVQWSIKCILEDRRVNLKVGNFLSAKLVDILLGLIVLYCVSAYEISLIDILNDSATELITNLQQLLKFLMGSPVGLKLNHAFNNTLGNFFLYHIALWRTFLLVTSPLVGTVYTLVSVVATMGFSFQAALVADVLTLASFHVYCIYVYAARLYGVQVHGLVSLWRLFIGRKQNPLRHRVDSCQYSHHQLFIGTLAFTILLFLLPTTMLYYAVFSTLRLVMTVTDRLLLWTRQLILGLPLYVTCLWAVNSPRIRGTVHVQIADHQKRNTGAVTLQATLISDSWWYCVTNSRVSCQPSVHQVSFGTLVHSLATGNLF